MKNWKIILGCLLSLLCLCRGASAQLEVDKGLHLTHVHGAVYDKAGKALAGAKVELVREDNVIVSATTGQDGGFRFTHVEGNYELRVTAAHFSPASREILVSMELARAVRGQNLYVLMGPGVCAESCSLITTSKKEFQEIVRRNSGH